MISLRGLARAVALFLVSAWCSDAFADYEAALFGVGTSAPYCGADALNYADDAVGSFSDSLTSLFGPNYDQIVQNLDAAVDPRDWIDYTICKNGTCGEDQIDPYGTDFADVVFIYTHGSYTCSPAYQSSLVMGDASPTWDPCAVTLTRDYTAQPYSNGQVRLGDVDTNALLIFGCGVLQWCMHKNHLPPSFLDVDRGETGAQLSLLNGFHGTVTVDYWMAHDLDSYGNDSHDNGLGDNWIDHFTDINSGSNNDNCAVSVEFNDGSTTYRGDMYQYGGLFDFLSTGPNHANETYWRIVGCDPPDGEALP